MWRDHSSETEKSLPDVITSCRLIECFISQSLISAVYWQTVHVSHDAALHITINCVFTATSSDYSVSSDLLYVYMLWLRWHLSKRFSSRIIWNSNAVLLKSQSFNYCPEVKSSLKQTPCFPGLITARMPVLSACLSKRLLSYIYAVFLFPLSTKSNTPSDQRCMMSMLHDVKCSTVKIPKVYCG